MDIGPAQAIWTIVVMVIFIGITLWAWSSKRKEKFNEAARIPMDDDEPVTQSMSDVEDNHG